MNAFELPDGDRQRVQAAKRYLEFLRVPALSLGLYVLPAGGVDAQQPRRRSAAALIRDQSRRKPLALVTNRARGAT